jgi:hypothetical protein
MNMSYCRFTNALQDLRDCEEHIEDDDLSPAEYQARRKLIELCGKIADNWEDEDTE